MSGLGPDVLAARPATGVAAPARPPTMLALGESRLGPWCPAPWIGELLALGARTARYARSHPSSQLVIAITVPTRDYAAVLIGCGWTLAAPRPNLLSPAEVVATLEPGTPVRVVTEQLVITDYFNGLEHAWNGDRIQLGGRQWLFEPVKALAVLDHLDEADRGCRQATPLPGSVSAWTGVSKYWEEHLAAPPGDLAIVGIGSWLAEEMGAGLSRDGLAPDVLGDEIRDVLLPREAGTATCSTEVLQASKFDPEEDTVISPRAVVLDGGSTPAYLSVIAVPVVFVVLDRRAADETAAEAVLQHRSGGEPLSLVDSLKWRPSAGIEALAYRVPL